MLVLSPFGEGVRRATRETARARNRLVASLADEVFVAYAEPGSATEDLCREVLGWGKPLLTLDSPENAGLISLGAEAVLPESLSERWGRLPQADWTGRAAIRGWISENSRQKP